MLLDGVNHIAWISHDVARLGRFYAEVFDAEVGPTRPHGQDPGETMTVIRIGPHTELNIVTIDGNTEPDRQTPMWGRGRIDHFGLHAATPEAFDTIRQRLVAPAPVTARSTTSAASTACSSAIPTGSKVRSSSPRHDRPPC